MGRVGRKSLLFGEPVKISPQKPVTFPTDHPGPEDKPGCQKALLSHTATFKRQLVLFVVPRESGLNGFTMCRLLWRVAGGCCLLPESEQRQTLENPTDVEVTLPALYGKGRGRSSTHPRP